VVEPPPLWPPHRFDHIPLTKSLRLNPTNLVRGGTVDAKVSHLQW
jgi:hypothetical protein